MSGIPESDAELAALYPATTEATAYSLDLTTTAASLTLPVGWYEMHLEASAGMALARLGGTAAVPASGDSDTGWWLAPGIPRTVVVRAGVALSAIMSTGTGTLRVTRLRAAA